MESHVIENPYLTYVLGPGGSPRGRTGKPAVYQSCTPARGEIWAQNIRISLMSGFRKISISLIFRPIVLKIDMES